MAASQNRLLTEQIAYYRARADEYDEWFLRQGRHDHGSDENAAWHAEVEMMASAQGWRADLHETERFFLYGSAMPIGQTG